MVKARLKILYSCCLLFSTLICGASDIPRHTFKPDYPGAPNKLARKVVPYPQRKASQGY